jgi:hypothetical protein
MIRPYSGRSTALGSGASLDKAKCVRDDDFLYTHAVRDCDDLFSAECISIADQIPGRFVPRKRFSNLLRGPRFGGTTRSAR